MQKPSTGSNTAEGSPCGWWTNRPTGGRWVSLATPMHEVHRSRLLAFDAVKWVPR